MAFGLKFLDLAVSGFYFVTCRIADRQSLLI